MLMRHMVSLGKLREGGMGLLILMEVGSGVVINGGIGGVMGRRRKLEACGSRAGDIQLTERKTIIERNHHHLT